MITKRNNSEKQIINVGNYSIAIIKEKVRSRFSSKTFVYKYSIKGNYYENEDGMNDILSKKYKAGDQEFDLPARLLELNKAKEFILQISSNEQQWDEMSKNAMNTSKLFRRDNADKFVELYLKE